MFEENCRKLIERGICKADCCGLVPFSKETWEKHKGKATKQAELIEEFGKITPVTTRCVFLSNEKHCLIYEDRPDVCGFFGQIPRLPCPFLRADGVRRSTLETKLIVIKQAKWVEDVLKKMVGK